MARTWYALKGNGPEFEFQLYPLLAMGFRANLLTSLIILIYKIETIKPS